MKLIRTRTREALGFNDLRLVFFGTIVISLLIPIAFFDINPIFEPDQYLTKFYISISFVIIHWNVDRKILAFFRCRLKNREDYAKRLIYQGITILAFIMLFCFFADSLLCRILSETTKETKPSYLQSILMSTIISTAVISIYESIYALNAWKDSSLQAEKLKKENYTSQLEALKSQVNPHFLFNSLNTLSATIHEDPDLAVELVQNLSKVYRYILETKDKSLVRLEDEFKSIKSHIFLLEARFGEKLKVDIQLKEEDYKLSIIPLAVQMLFENAIKHNIIAHQKPLKISIFRKDDYLIIQNNFQPKQQEQSNSTQTGLCNIRQRYELLTQKSIHINPSDDSFEVALPLINVKTYESTNR